MKRKKFEKKLGLNKVTVANLSQDQLMEILGGGEPACTANCTHDCFTEPLDYCDKEIIKLPPPGTTC